jgi:ABC-type branched-subunit amino acid transport system permease subunit
VLYQIIISQSQITGGTSGMVSLPGLELFGIRFARNGKIGYYTPFSPGAENPWAK